MGLEQSKRLKDLPLHLCARMIAHSFLWIGKNAILNLPIVDKDVPDTL